MGQIEVLETRDVGGGEAAASSLVPSHQTVPTDERPECPNPKPDVRLVNRDTGQIRMVGCGRLKCWVCAAYLAWRRGLAISWAKPERRFDLTLVGEDWNTVRARMKRLRFDIADSGFAVEWSWSVEANPRGTGHHVHGHQHGDFIPQAQLSDMAVRRGMGEVVYIKAAERYGSAKGYGLKALTYGMKGATREESHGVHLDLNGGRLSHHSRGFFGVPVREAERLAVESRRGGEPSPWLLATVAELHAAFGKAPR